MQPLNWVIDIIMEKYDFLIVGAGLFGATFAHLAHLNGKNSLVIDRRDVVGGNIYCEVIDDIAVHKYGAHIFHTSDKKIWDFVTSLVPFNRYTNCPVACYQDQLYNLPFNMNTFHQLWGIRTPEEAQLKLDEQRQKVTLKMKALGVEAPRNLEEQALLLVGEDIYNKLIKGYTEKQWGRPCSQLPAFIIRRLPVRLTYDNNYFNDAYQGIPDSHDGYNTLVNMLLSGGDIDIHLGCDYFSKSHSYWKSIARKVIFTGPIDQFFNYRFGRLNYRSVAFEIIRESKPNVQGNAVVNYTDSSVPYTRIIEHKHFNTFGEDVYRNPVSIISREYSQEWEPGIEPYYPINDPVNNALYQRYKELADTLPNIHFAGRLGQYRYLDMDKTIGEAMTLAKELFGHD